jgi:hypothetical protein
MDKMKKYMKLCKTYITLEAKYSKNIGLFSVKWFLKNKKDLLSMFVNLDLSKKKDYKYGIFPNNEEIHQRFKYLPRCLNEDALIERDTTEGKERPRKSNLFPSKNNKQYMEEQKYGGLLRKATLYSEAGIIKYQSNWGQYNGYVMEL